MHVLKKDLEQAFAEIQVLLKGAGCASSEGRELRARVILRQVQAVVQRFPGPNPELRRLKEKALDLERERNNTMCEMRACQKALENHERFLASLCNMLDVSALSSVRTRVADGSLPDVTSMLQEYEPEHVLLQP